MRASESALVPMPRFDRKSNNASASASPHNCSGRRRDDECMQREERHRHIGAHAANTSGIQEL
jgi:hypothetical protein